MIDRFCLQQLEQKLDSSNKVILLFGVRQIGKTTLCKLLAEKRGGLYINGDNAKYHSVLGSMNTDTMKELIGNYKLIIIDEAQRVPNIGIALKLIYDELTDVRVIATGSSSFELANKSVESLAGRFVRLQMYPLSFQELVDYESLFEYKSKLHHFLNYGKYPEVVLMDNPKQKIEHLENLVGSYLFKDVLQLTNIRHSDKIYKLLKLLAFQIGNLVSVNELANALKMSQPTVNSYIDMLEQGFIIERLTGYSTNPRKEISKMDKIYFTDLGVRNALINNFNDIEFRNDVGALWENFLYIERQKFRSATLAGGNIYFWRSYAGSEVDYIEEYNQNLFGYEFKWGGRKSRKPKWWLEQYNGEFQLVNRDNFVDFVRTDR